VNKYSKFEQFFHRLALSNNFMKEMSFEIEKNVFLNRCNSKIRQTVFVTGLARAGTTILLRAIHESDKFASFSYKDMPFVLAPNLWSKVNRINSKEKKVERAHGDGIKVNSSSPEAFEEVFWATFSKSDADSLFKDYIKLILYKNNKSRYLSKNNQNIRRINLLMKILPDSKILIVFKEPLRHAYSLLRQHKRFSKLQKDDKFIKEYMNLIEHSEFGISYKPIISKEIIFSNPFDINHWLEQWLKVYSKTLLDYAENKNIKFVCGDDLYLGKSWKGICKFIEINHNFNEFKDVRIESDIKFNKALKDECNEIYKKLLSIAI